MKKNVRNVMILGLVAGISFVSCREVQEDEAAPPMQNEMHQGDHANHDAVDDVVLNTETTAQFEDEQIAAVYQHYINIKKALVQTDAALARERAGEMIASLENTNVKDDITAAARNISANSDVNAQREAFSQLTKAIEPKLEEAIVAGEIYKQHCPMAWEGKGDSWFSNSQEIRNPYYGDKMLKCGRVEATIN